ncbi:MULTISPECIES: hypothetical protein [Novosphingobium]|uniref:Uncharacterized protein n=2 Tax=Novosphingobium TaxID=165696 RepID=A0ABT0AAN0_9SPHN|nr:MULTISPECIES: hypothetical protein [Novosphingobium]MCJ1960263.1 hypothetical protein [Novosphingobium mangrovi (ex Hu et al. 2023)]MED5544965.1 hypothetical protein [Pseudomonadota bacterium]QVM84359.1 hypothetical protein HT578_12265 [Novosphingobium decolorationis]GAM04709.1 hypothetical conserved protein [Novosphingobium sp. MBES04]
MWQWFTGNTQVVSVALSFAMLIVWVIYLQLLLVQFRGTKRSTILITRAAGRGMRSRCLVTNMSSQPLYVSSLIATVHVRGRQIELALTDLRELPGDLGEDPRSIMGQGSLATGQFMNIGHFDDIVRTLLDANEETDVQEEEVDQFDLTVVALYALEDLPVGATRSFHFERNVPKGPRVQPLSIATDQIRQRRRRRDLLNKVQQYL